jgi:hypothetical protein
MGDLHRRCAAASGLRVHGPRDAGMIAAAMADVIKLGKARKARAQAQARAQADANAARHGRTKAERGRLRAEAERADARHEGHRRGPVIVPAAGAEGGDAGPDAAPPDDGDGPT